MKKSTVIANCLCNSEIVTSIDAGEEVVFKSFYEDNPNGNFLEWNQEINEVTAQHLINTVGKAANVNVSKFIKYLA